MQEESYDLVVVGSGIAGQTAAASAAESGLSVALLEKTESLGGSSKLSGGWFAFVGTDEQEASGVEDSKELFLSDLLSVGDHQNDERLLAAYLENQDDAYRWLKERGVVFRDLEISSGQSARRSHNSSIGDVLARLHQAFEAAGGHSFLRHRALRLTRDKDGRVSGVVAETPAGEMSFAARGGVVLATGGFSRGREMLKIFAPEQLRAIPFGGAGNTGDGLRMAWKLGAGMADMSSISATYGSHPETSADRHELLTAFYMGAIIVNSSGQRFVDESLDYKTLGRVVLDQPEELGIQIFDAVVRAKSRRGIPLKDMDTLEDLGHLHKSKTIGELAVTMGLDPAALVATVDKYNAVVHGEHSDELGRTSLCNGVGTLLPIQNPPFYAYPAKPLMTTTYCGVTIDRRARVVDVDGEIIEGLYAVGEVTGGFHGAAYMTGTSLGKGTVFGRIAARQVHTALQSVLVDRAR